MVRYHVERSTEINAPPEKVFQAVSDFDTWTSWSPWLCSEPEAKVIVTENSDSVGSLYQWNGEIVGQGEVEHVQLNPHTLIEDEIRFLKPFRSTSKVSFDFEPSGEGTKITWHMHGNLPWFLFWMRPMMEGFLGMDYERGLKMLKEWMETGKIETQTTIRGVESIGPLQVAGARRSCAMRDIGVVMKEAFAECEEKLAAHNLPTDGEPVSIYHKFDMKGQTCEFTSGYVMDSPEPLPSDMSTWSLPACQALCTEHRGSYEHLGNAWSAANQYARHKKLKQRKVGAFEIYRNKPEDTASEDLLTQVYLPLK